MKLDLETYQRERALEDRIADLEETHRKTLDAINTVTEIAELRGTAGRIGDARPVYEALRAQLSRILPLRAIAILTVDHASGEFVMAYQEPEAAQAELAAEVDRQITAGTFAWSLRENRMSMSSGSSEAGTVLLYPIASHSTVAGMLVAILDDAGEGIPEVSVVLLSAVVLICGLVLENVELRSDAMSRKVHA
jgi:hypothetical protein